MASKRNQIDKIRDPSGTTLTLTEIVDSEWCRHLRVGVKGAQAGGAGEGRPFSASFVIKSPKEKDDFVRLTEQVLDAADGASREQHYADACRKLQWIATGAHSRHTFRIGLAQDQEWLVGAKKLYGSAEGAARVSEESLRRLVGSVSLYS